MSRFRTKTICSRPSGDSIRIKQEKPGVNGLQKAIANGTDLRKFWKASKDTNGTFRGQQDEAKYTCSIFSVQPRTLE